jgi:hypothetical protein
MIGILNSISSTQNPFTYIIEIRYLCREPRHFLSGKYVYHSIYFFEFLDDLLNMSFFYKTMKIYLKGDYFAIFINYFWRFWLNAGHVCAIWIDDIDSFKKNALLIWKLYLHWDYILNFPVNSMVFNFFRVHL